MIPNIASVQPHLLIDILIPNSLAITSIKTTVHKQLFFRRRTRALELRRRECE